MFRWLLICIFKISISFPPSMQSIASAEDQTLRVMTLNIWIGGESGRQPLEQTTKLIQAANADMVGLQETHGEKRNGKRPDAAESIARQLSWHYFNQGDKDTGIISRYRIVDQTPKKWGAAIELPSGKRAWLFNAHFMHTPYQPYQLLDIPYNDAPFIKTEQQAIAEARAARGKQVAAMLAEIEQVRSAGTPIFITGDFNEPSPLDWTDAVFRARRAPLAVRWPTTTAVHDAGFVDAYREIHPDPLKAPGYTWTPVTSESDPQDRHDRIDFVFVGGRGAKVKDAKMIGERAEKADVVVMPYPSDHRGVVATVALD
jgi:exodeoxyribonuclease-3